MPSPSMDSDTEDAQGFFRIWRAFSGVVFPICIFFIGIQAIGCIIVLVLSKHEKPHVPLRAFIIGQLCACGVCLICSFLDFMSKRKYTKQTTDVITSDSGAAGKAIVSFAKVQLALACIKWMIAFFTLGWYITGSIWVSMASSTRSDTPILFWSTLSFILTAASGIALAYIILVISRCASCTMCCSDF